MHLNPATVDRITREHVIAALRGYTGDVAAHGLTAVHLVVWTIMHFADDEPIPEPLTLFTTAGDRCHQLLAAAVERFAGNGPPAVDDLERGADVIVGKWVEFVSRRMTPGEWN